MAKQGFCNQKLGAHRLPRKGESENAFDLAINAINRLFESGHINCKEVDILCVISQNPGTFIPHVSAKLHGHFDLPDRCSTFDVSLGCSGYVQGLSIISAFMESNSLNNGILVTSDPYSDIINSSDPNTSLLFGDGATATLISNEPNFDSLHIGRLYSYSDGASGHYIQRGEDGFLSMNGRAVFNFASRIVPVEIKRCLELENISISFLDKVILHQGSKAIVDNIARCFPDNENKFLSDISITGNTVSSSIPLLLEKFHFKSSLKYRNIISSGFGVGLSVATMHLKCPSNLNDD